MKINHIYLGDAKKVLKSFPNESIDMIMTSPPYWALRDYGVKEQLGLENNFSEYLDRLCNIFDEAKKVLRDEGTCWVNLGDTYAGSQSTNSSVSSINQLNTHITKAYRKEALNKKVKGIPNKSLSLIPFRFALEMINRGWILRNVIIWHKPNCMPTSAKDRFTVDFEYLFFFVKSKKYYFRPQYEPHSEDSIRRAEYEKRRVDCGKENSNVGAKSEKYGMPARIVKLNPLGHNKRTTWTIHTKGFSGNHFATYPEKLCEIPINAGCPENGIVLDPFFGAGTTGLVAVKQNRRFIGIEINKSYVKLAKKRIKDGTK